MLEPGAQLRMAQAGPEGVTNHEHLPPELTCLLAVWPRSLCVSVSSPVNGDTNITQRTELFKSLDEELPWWCSG